MSYYSTNELIDQGFKKLGKNVLISKKASFYGIGNIEIGDNSRIDDFVVLSAGVGGIIIGNNVHVAVYSSMIGAGKIIIGDYSNVSSRVSIYSSNDDYSGEFMTNPTVSTEYTGVNSDKITVGQHVIIGCGCVILPGIIINDGVAIGALSLVKYDCDEFTIYSGNPAKKIKLRSRALLQKADDFLSSQLKK